MIRPLAATLLILGLAGSSLAQTPNPNDAGFAQPAPPVEDSGGDPLYGYLAFAVFAAGAVFAVTKSSRRS